MRYHLGSAAHAAAFSLRWQSQAYKIRRRSVWSLGIMLEEATVIVADDHPMFRVALRLGVERIDPAMRVIEVDSLTRSEEHTSELQSLMSTSYAVYCLTIKTIHT